MKDSTSKEHSCDEEQISATIGEDGNVLFLNLFEKDYEILDELGLDKTQEPVPGLENLFKRHLCG